tara:strand:- start:110970 stop:112001 length:1032 start_codon:yes stop_codon:yes gene_type:complete
MRKVALITGVTGQDGYYLSKFLLSKNYEVHGMRQALAHDDRIYLAAIKDKIIFHYGDMTDQDSLGSIVRRVKPDELYNLAAQSHVGVSFEVPSYTKNVNGVGVERLLSAVRQYAPNCRFYQAGTSELFGNSPAPQNEHSPFSPQSPYAEGKLIAHQAVMRYRDEYGLFAVNGVLFNHESPLRGDGFVTQKIVKGALSVKRDAESCLCLGNIDARRDWGHAADYVEGMWHMLQQDKAEDFILASGVGCSVRDFTREVFAQIGLEIKWRGEGVNEVAILLDTGRVVVKISPELYRPADVHELCGDASTALRRFGWRAKTSRSAMIHDMITAAQNAYPSRPLIRAS